MDTTILAVVIVEAVAILVGTLKISYGAGKLTERLNDLCHRVSRLEKAANCDESTGEE